MAELLEEIKKMSRTEQLALADQIYALDEEALSDDERQLLVERAQEAAKNPLGGTPWEEVKARMMAKMQAHTS